MSKLVWDKTGERYYETGVKNGVLYPIQPNGTYSKGVAWNGLTAVTESPSGATVEAYTYPDEFAECDGSASIADGVMIGQQARKIFGMSYKTTVGNDVDRNSHGYKLHLIYGATASRSEKAYATINDSPEAITFSWEIATTPVNVTGFKPTASLVIDSTKANPAKLASLEEILYGKDPTSEGLSDGVDPRLPLPDEIVTIMAAE